MSRRVLIVVALVACGLGLVYLSRANSAERRIARRFERIEELVDKRADEGRLTTVGKMRGLLELFHDPFEFRAAPFDFSTRDPRALAGAVQRYRAGAGRVTMRTRDREIHVDSAAGRATTYVTATFSGGLSDLDRDAYRFQVHWVEVEGEWKIDFVDLLEILPGGFGM